MIFKQLISGRQFSSFVLVKDNPDHSAHHILSKIIKENLERGNNVYLFNYESPESVLVDKFKSTTNFFVHNCFHDPWNLNIDGLKSSTPQIWKSSLATNRGVFNVVVLNSISQALKGHSLESICCHIKSLKAMNDENCRTQVIGVVNTSLTVDESRQFKELNRLAESVITLGSSPDSSRLNVIHRKSFGKLVEEDYIINLDEKKYLEYKETSKIPTGTVDAVSSDSTPHVLTTFKLTLEEKEKESRSQVVLPYLKNAGVSSGKIIYEPDANDDWDDEDPDDDLEI